VFIVAALLWGIVVDGYRPLSTDLIGVACCLVGVGVIVIGARGA
jgi:small multidrug resistance family-3 protein